MAVILGAITPRATVLNDDMLQLDGAFGVHPVIIGDSTFVYVAGRLDGGLSGFRVEADGSLTNVVNIDDGPPTEPLQIKGATHFASVAVGGSQFLYVTGSLDDGLSVFRIATDGTLSNVQNINDATDPALELDGTSGKLAVATLGSTTFLIASADDDNGLSVFRVALDGSLTNTFNVTDDRTLNLDDAHDVVTATVGGRVFVCVAGGDDDGLSVFELHADGTLSNTFNIADDPELEIDNPWGLATAAVDGNQYLIASGRDDNGLSVFALSETGTLTNVFNVQDTPARGLAGAFGLTTFTIEGETFVTVSGGADSAVTVFHLDPSGTLTDVTTIFDTAATALGYTVDNAFAVVDGRPLLLVSGYGDGGLTSFEIGRGNDTLTGTSGTDLLMGFAGDDWLDGAGGADHMIGGAGNDTYVIDQPGDLIIERARAGTDTVRAPISYRLGENVENLVLLDGARGGTGNGLDNRLIGNDQANRLTGLGGQDRLQGGGGRDTLLGGQGRDTLLGGQGADDLFGSKGKDVLKGGAGADDFIFARLSDSGPSKLARDVLLDFGHKDQIDLSAIDAIRGQKGNQAFDLDRDGSFDAGEVRQTEVAGGVLLEVNVDGGAKAEMALFLKGFHGTLNHGDFVF